MQAIEEGSIVWALEHALSQWSPAVVLCNPPPEGDVPSKLSVIFVNHNYRSFEDCNGGKIFELDRRNVRQFDASLASQYRGRRKHKSLAEFHKVVNMAKDWQADYRKRAKDEYDAKINALRDIGDESNAHHDLNILEEERIELAAGSKIFFWAPGQVVGRSESAKYARVLTVYHPDRYAETDIPLELDTGHILTSETLVRMIEPVQCDRMVPLCDFRLKPSAVDGIRVSDVIAQNIKDHVHFLKQENPKFAHLINDPLAPRKKNRKIRQTEPKKKAPDPVPKIIRSQSRPVVSDSDSSASEKFVPQLLAPTRLQSRNQTLVPDRNIKTAWRVASLTSASSANATPKRRPSLSKLTAKTLVSDGVASDDGSVGHQKAPYSRTEAKPKKKSLAKARSRKSILKSTVSPIKRHFQPANKIPIEFSNGSSQKQESNSDVDSVLDMELKSLKKRARMAQRKKKLLMSTSSKDQGSESD